MNKAEFFRGIDWEAPLSWGFLTKLYGYSMYDQQFLADVLTEYEKHGRDRVKNIYLVYVNLEELHRKHEIAPIAREFTKQIDTNYERQVKNHEWRKKKYLQSLSDEELTQMLKNARQCQMPER